MSWYMSVRIKCIIKEEFRKDFEPIALHGLWGSSNHPVLKDFGSDEDAIYIPTNPCSFPAEWEGCDEEYGEYETSWDKEIGEWTFAYSINRIGNYVHRDFVDIIVPLIVERFLKYELWIEPMNDLDSDEPADITDFMNKRLIN